MKAWCADIKKYLEAGIVVNTHGLNGEVKINPWCDSPDFLLKFNRLFIDGTPKKIISARVHKGCVLALIEGVASVNAAMALRGKVVFIDREDVSLPPGKVFLQDLVGLKVYDSRVERVIGEISEVLQPPAHDVFVVQEGTHTHLIPAIPPFHEKTDLALGMVYVKTIEGMLSGEN